MFDRLGLVLGLGLGLGFGLELIILGNLSLYYYAHSITPCQRLSVPYPWHGLHWVQQTVLDFICQGV